jgi:hypothetical protein
LFDVGGFIAQLHTNQKEEGRQDFTMRKGF